jgi:hypothetical protein
MSFRRYLCIMHGLNVSKDMATPILSKTQIDRLGDRLKRGSYAEDDLRALDS